MEKEKEQLSKMQWVAGFSKIDYSDLKDKGKIEKAIDESIKDLANRLREFATIRLCESNNMNDVIVRAEIRVLDTPDLKKEIIFIGHLGSEKIEL